MQLIDDTTTMVIRRAYAVGGLGHAVAELRRHLMIEDDRLALATVEALLAAPTAGSSPTHDPAS